MDNIQKVIFWCIAVTFIVSTIACKSVSKYTIDGKPLLKIDTNLLGIWKAKEDTDKKNFVLIQDNYDVHHNIDSYKYDVHHKTDKYKSGAFAMYDNDYFITYLNWHGKNPLYEQFYSYLSEVKKTMFLNVSNHYTPILDGQFQTNEETSGYFFVKLIDINATYDAITIAIIADTTLKYLKNSKEVRNKVAENINNPAFYSDTLHFDKVSGYHLSLNESKLKANQ